MKNQLFKIGFIFLLTIALGCQKSENDTSASVQNPGEIDRTILPIQPPETEAITEMDARNVETPKRFEVKAPEVPILSGVLRKSIFLAGSIEMGVA